MAQSRLILSLTSREEPEEARALLIMDLVFAVAIVAITEAVKKAAMVAVESKG